MIARETAIVYRGWKRRYLTREAAARSLAWAAFSKKHGCECDEAEHATGYPGFRCGNHADTPESKAIVERYAKRLLRQTDL